MIKEQTVLLSIFILAHKQGDGETEISTTVELVVVDYALGPRANVSDFLSRTRNLSPSVLTSIPRGAFSNAHNVKTNPPLFFSTDHSYSPDR